MWFVCWDDWVYSNNCVIVVVVVNSVTGPYQKLARGPGKKNVSEYSSCSLCTRGRPSRLFSPGRKKFSCRKPIDWVCVWGGHTAPHTQTHTASYKFRPVGRVHIIYRQQTTLGSPGELVFSATVMATVWDMHCCEPVLFTVPLSHPTFSYLPCPSSGSTTCIVTVRQEARLSAPLITCSWRALGQGATVWALPLEVTLEVIVFVRYKWVVCDDHMQ